MSCVCLVSQAERPEMAHILAPSLADSVGCGIVHLSLISPAHIFGFLLLLAAGLCARCQCVDAKRTASSRFQVLLSFRTRQGPIEYDGEGYLGLEQSLARLSNRSLNEKGKITRRSILCVLDVESWSGMAWHGVAWRVSAMIYTLESLQGHVYLTHSISTCHSSCPGNLSADQSWMNQRRRDSKITTFYSMT